MDSAGGKGARLADPLAKASATGAPLLGGLRQDGAPGAGQGREQRIRSRLTTADHDGQGKKLAVRLTTARTCLLTELRSVFPQFSGHVAGLVGRVAGHDRSGGAGPGCGWLGGAVGGPAGSYRGS